MSVQLQERIAGGREFQILEDATEKLRAPNAVRTNGTASRLVLEDRREVTLCRKCSFVVAGLNGVKLRKFTLPAQDYETEISAALLCRIYL